MLRKTKVVLAATGVALAASASTGIALADGGQDHDRDRGHRHGTQVIRFEAHPVHVEFLDLGTEGTSAGDMHTFSNDMYQNGEKIGYDGGSCVNERVTAKTVTVNCRDVIKLPGGQISVSFIRVDPIGAPPSDPFWGAVTGGTGEYRNARGQLRVDPGNAKAHATTIYLEQGHRR